MKKKYLFLVLCTFFYVSIGVAQEVKKTAIEPAVSDTPTEDEELVSHKVMMGETIMMIAKKYKIKPKDIYEYNPDATEGIAANNLLQIPMHRALKKKKALDPNIQPQDALYSNGASATADVPKD